MPAPIALSEQVDTKEEYFDDDVVDEKRSLATEEVFPDEALLLRKRRPIYRSPYFLFTCASLLLLALLVVLFRPPNLEGYSSVSAASTDDVSLSSPLDLSLETNAEVVSDVTQEETIDYQEPEEAPKPQTIVDHLTETASKVHQKIDQAVQKVQDKVGETVQKVHESITFSIDYLRNSVKNLVDNWAGKTEYPPAQLWTDDMPVCERTLLYKFYINTGFTGQFVLLMQSAYAAKAYNYTLILDDSMWNYGRFTSYFQQMKLDCKPPADYLDIERIGVDTHTRDWFKNDHVLSPTNMGSLNNIIMGGLTDTKFMNEQHQRDFDEYPLPTPLTGAQTVPDFFHRVFEEEADIISQYWRPNEVVTAMMEEQAVEFGWNLTTWDQRKKADVEDFIIGAHVRKGDKCHEVGTVKASPLRFAPKGYDTQSDVHVDCSNREGIDDNHSRPFFNAAEAHVNRLLGRPEDGISTAKWTGKAQFVAFSDNPDVVTMLEGHPNSAFFRIQQTKNTDDSKFEHGFMGSSFNNFATKDKIEATLPLVRDMTLLAQRADALVFTATSNVARIFALLAGAEKAKQELFSSADGIRWFPTSAYE